MNPELQQLLAKTAGLAIAIHVAVWIVFHLLFRRMERPPRLSFHLFALPLGVWTAGRVFSIREAWVNHLGAALVFTTALLLWVLFDRLICGAWLAHHRKIHIPVILRQLGGMLVVLVAGTSILKWGYRLELTGLLATSGIAAVILGFAMQDLLGNVIAGFSIHMSRAYRVGDWLLLGEKGDRAEVTEINWRSTRLVNNDLVSLEIANSEVVRNRIVNLNYPTPEHGIRLRIGLFGPGEALVSCGETGDSMFVILDGRVEVAGQSDAGSQVVLAKLGPGEYFGEISLLTGEPRNATVCAETDTLLLEIRKKDISPLIEANPALAGRLGELLERRQSERLEALHGGRGKPESRPPQQRSWSERIHRFFGDPAG